MAFTDAEETRIQTLEETVNELSTIVKQNLASKLEMRQLLLIKQTEIDALRREVDALQSQLTTLQKRLD